MNPTLPIDARLLRPFLERQRWFAGKARTVLDVRLADWAPLEPEPVRAWLAVLEVEYTENHTEFYAAPLMREPRSGAISDALEQDAACTSVVTAALSGRPLAAEHGSVRWIPGPEPVPEDEIARLPVRRGSPDQSNTCVIFGSRYILKLMRRLDPGPNIELEIGRHLSSVGFANAPPFAGALEYAAPHAEAASLAIVQGFVANEGTAWEAALADVARDLTKGREPGASYQAAAERLGERTGELHMALAQPTKDPAFVPERYQRGELAARIELMQAEAGRALALLESKLGTLSSAVFQQAKVLLDGRAAMHERLAAIAQRPMRAERIRVHGDYHLGQVLAAGDDFVIIDFEGEPARTLQERRAKASPLKDVAGMLRSFGYAAQAGLDRAAGGDAAARTRFADPARTWESAASGAFLLGYRRATADASFLPGGDDFQALLEAFIIEKAFYELAYELGSRPDWVRIPLDALVRLLP